MEPEEYIITITGPGLHVVSTPIEPNDLELIYNVLPRIAARLEGRRLQEAVDRKEITAEDKALFENPMYRNGPLYRRLRDGAAAEMEALSERVRRDES